MSFGASDLGVIGQLGKALGVFDVDGNPNPDWFSSPDVSLKSMLSSAGQRAALIAFVDEALGGAERSVESGVTWLPIVDVDDPPLSVAVTIDEAASDGLHIGVGLRCTTNDPGSVTTLSIPLFLARKQGGPPVSNVLLLGTPGGRIRIATAITIDGAAAVPGQARLGGIGLDVEVPTSESDTRGPQFGLSLTGLQLPGAQAPRDVRVAADGADALDDALLDLVLGLIKAQADAAAPASPIAALGGLLGLKDGDSVLDFPITALPTRGAMAIADWVRATLSDTASRSDWLGHLASFIGGSLVGDAVHFGLGGAAVLELALHVDSGPTGNPRLTPELTVELGNSSARVEVQADIFRIDLITGQTIALPRLGLWAAAGDHTSPILDVSAPTVARAETLRLGFELDASRRLLFVLAADTVTLGTHIYPSLDLTSPDAVMDAVGNTVSDVANQLLAGLGDALGVVRELVGLDAPSGVTAVTLPALMTDPMAAVAGYWQSLIASPAALQSVLSTLRAAFADASQAAAAVIGSGSVDDPFRLPLIGPLRLELVTSGTQLSVGLAAVTSVDTLGQRCTVVQTRIAATLAQIELAARSAKLLTGVEATLTARERGADPPRARLVLTDGITLTADSVGLRLAWSPDAGLIANVLAPSLTLAHQGWSMPIVLPTFGESGLEVSSEAWDSVEMLVGHLARLTGGFLADAVHLVGWRDAVDEQGAPRVARLRLRELVISPDLALRHWLCELLLSDLAPHALALMADVFGAHDVTRSFLRGNGLPDDPFRFALEPHLPNVAVWFPPHGLRPTIVAAPTGLRAWRPGQPGLPSIALAAALLAEATVAEDVRALIVGRDVAVGLESLAQRLALGDGRIVAPTIAPSGVSVRRIGCAGFQLTAHLDLEDWIGRAPTTTVYVAIGASAWPGAPAGRHLDLTAPGLTPNMFAAPAPATGDWFISLGGRNACRPSGTSSDGTPEQAARLAVVLDALATVSSDMALVAIAGAGHAARIAAQAQSAVTDLVTLGTPLSPIALTALDTQPTADALRLLQRLLPQSSLQLSIASGSAPALELDDEDLALGRALVVALMELTTLTDPGVELRPSVVPAEPPRAGLAYLAVFGEVSLERVRQGITAIVASGLAERARARARLTYPDARAVHAGLRWEFDDDATGALAVTGNADLRLLAFDADTGLDSERLLRVDLRIGDRLGWLTATPDIELRAVSLRVALPLSGNAAGEARVVLHEARVFGQSWEALTLGNVTDALPLMPEARVLLSSFAQRLTADVAGNASVAVCSLLRALGSIGEGGGLVSDALEQLLFDPAGLVRARLVSAGAELGAAMNVMLGGRAASVDFAAHSVQLHGGGAELGRFGWELDAVVSPSALNGTLRVGPQAALPMVGGLAVELELNPLRANLIRYRSGGTSDQLSEQVALWPAPNGEALVRMLITAAPSVAASFALEVMRRADVTAQPVIDAILDAFGLLSGSVGDVERAVRPLAGLLSDPAGWLRSVESLAASPLKIQRLFDALRPLMDLPGAAGASLALADGVELSVTPDAAGARLSLLVDPGAWTAPSGSTGRLAGGIGASLSVKPSGPPSVALELYAGVPGSAAGRRAVHARLGTSGVEVFLRPATGADIPLIPFAGLGALSTLAEAALPYLLDRLAELPGTPGQLVQRVGDALALRSGTPAQFSADALHNWAANPVGALATVVPSIVATGLTNIAPLLDDFLPSSVTATATATELSVTVAGVSLGWSPTAGRVLMTAPSLPVPGIEALGLRLAFSAAGLDELSVAVGPARIDAGGVLLRPFASISTGLSPLAGRRIAVGLSADETHHFAIRCSLDSGSLELVASDGALAAASDSTEPKQVALRIVEVVIDLVAAVAMAQTPVQELLDTTVGDITVRALLRGVVLEDTVNPTQLIDQLFVPERWLDRASHLFENIAAAGIAFDIDGLRLSFTEHDNVIGLQLGVIDRFELIDSDVKLWLENDVTWIEPRDTDDGGLFVGFLSTSPSLRFVPSLAVEGLGLRIGKASGPLLDIGFTLESIALHAFASIDSGGIQGGGVQLQFSNLGVPASGAQGNNAIAQGILKDSGPTPPKPAFSPALAIQKHGNGPVSVSLRAGDGAGPWWIAIRKGFGPIYLEQIGFGATMPEGRLERISLLMDGSVSMFGLTCAVDDLQITYLVSNGDFFNPTNWEVDLAGLAVSANMAGVSIAGGLLKQTTPAGIEYLGMLLGRFAVYGLTVYGGYGQGGQGDDKFTAFFAIGAVNGPIGGPPAFFLTGIGGGFGINRKLVVPSELSNFANYPLIQALDIAAQPSDPMTQLRELGQYFPMQKGTFWFAAGLAFNSFALVDGIAVIGVQIGDGLDINLLGLARMALPRPQAALVSIELALLVRFSSSEGVLWVQGQLTDNSWLLYPDIKLTGGFAYVIWFKGEKAGEFVLTLGGYHPSFHRDGYPVVPRLGLRWSIGDNIVIKAGSYFALTSEALMAGGDFEASASFGPAWAEVKFGANGIVYFDPFSYDVDAYARIAAGVTIDTWIFGEITISISLGARIHVLGPEFRGSVTFDVGPISLTFEFGGSEKALKEPLGEIEFINKYLEAASSGKALIHAVMTNTGALPAKGEKSTPDGSSTRPFIVVAEFSLVFTSTAPITRIARTLAATTQHAPSLALGVAPRNVASIDPQLTLTWLRSGTAEAYPFVDHVRPFGRFPVGIWGPPQDTDNRKVPKAEMIEALSELELVCSAAVSAPGPEIAYFQVETGPRRPLPFARRNSDVMKLRTEAQAVSTAITQPTTTAAAFAAARNFIAGRATPTGLIALRGERQAPPRLGALTEGLEAPTVTLVPDVAERPPAKVYDHFIDAPLAVGMLRTASAALRVAPRARTTVNDAQRAWRRSPPTLAGVEVERSRSIAARLVLSDTPALSSQRSKTLIAAQSVPPTAIAQASPAVISRHGAALAASLAEFNSSLANSANSPQSPTRQRAPNAGATLASGQVVVLKLPNALADAANDTARPRLVVMDAPVRLVLLGHGGRRMVDKVIGPSAATTAIDVPRGTERIVAIGQSLGNSAANSSESSFGLLGWHAGMQLPFAGWSSALAPGCVVRRIGDRLALHRERLDAGWVSGAELARGTSTVTTTFAESLRVVIVVLDDPAAAGDPVAARRLLLGLDGAGRVLDSGAERAPTLLTMDNRSVLAYDIVSETEVPVVVTISTQAGWSLVGVLGSGALDAAGAIALIAARGLDAALQGFANHQVTAEVLPSRLRWEGPVRSSDERKRAQLMARGGAIRSREPSTSSTSKVSKKKGEG